MASNSILMCRPAYLGTSANTVAWSINPYMHMGAPIDAQLLNTQYDALVKAHRDLGRTIEWVDPDPALHDQTYSANFALCIGGKALLGNPRWPERTGEIPLATDKLTRLGFSTSAAPYHFSGQGDALRVNDNLIIMGNGWRTDPRMARVIAEYFDCQVVDVTTVPSPTDPTNSLFYDIDLAVAVLRPDLIAIAPEAFAPGEADKLRYLPGISAIEVSLAEAMTGTLNLIATDATIMIPDVVAPNFQAELSAHGFTLQPMAISELWKGGGGVRCTALDLNY